MTDHCTTFLDLRIIASRDGDRVTGRVEFPEVFKRGPVPIDYRSTRPAPEPVDGASDIDRLDARTRERFNAVQEYSALCVTAAPRSKGGLAKALAHRYGVSLRTLQLWSQKYETGGVDALRANYVPRPKKVVAMPADVATDAVKVAAWWSLRIDNFACIDSSTIGVAVSLLERGFKLDDIVATIDCYYAHDCDRAKYPFKPFARWAKYDFEKWLFRACDSADYLRGAAKDRKRDVNCRAHRQAVRSLVSEHFVAPPLRPPVADVEDGSKALRQASQLRSIGLRAVADHTVRRAAPGMPALAANDNPKTVAEALGRLDDAFRSMLIRAGQGDRDAKSEALATMPVWWPQMPADVRSNLDARIDAWKADHLHVTDEAASSRKLMMFLPSLRDDRSGVQRLFPAARIPT